MRPTLPALCALAALLLPASAQEATPAVRPSPETCVVLLHGMGRTSWSMVFMADALRRAGFRVLNVDYPSTRYPIARLAGDELERALRDRRADQFQRVHFVTHSLGGIVLRAYLRRNPMPNLGRVVMLSPPSQGSRLADRLGPLLLYRAATGPAGQELGTATGSVPRGLPPPDFEVGVIAGDRTVNPFFSALIPGADDGKVAPGEAGVAGMKDFLTLHVTHTWMMMNSEVIRQTLLFLREGRFDHGEE